MEPPPPDLFADYWQLKCDHIPDRGIRVLQSGQWADCTFLVGPEEVSMPAHRLLLAMASPVFEAMFYGSMAAGDTPVRISDMQPDVFKELLQYIYTDRVKIQPFESMCELYYAAKKYMLLYLAKKCLHYIRSNLLANNVCYAYELGMLFEEENLVKACLKEICNNTSEVLKASSFEESSLTTVVTVFSQQALNISSELELFLAAERCADARRRGLKRGSVAEHQGQAKRPRVDGERDAVPSEQVELQLHETRADADQTEATGDLDDQEHRASLRNALEHIRFLTLSAAEFAAHAAGSPLLSEAEALALLLHLAHPDTAEPLPQGFSPCREARQLSALTQRKESKAGAAPTETAEATIEYSVFNFKSRRRAVESAPVATRGVEWRLRVVPENIDSADKAVGVYVKCSGAPSHAWSVPAEVTLTVLNPHRSDLTKTVTFQHEYTSTKHTHGHQGFLTWEDLCHCTRGYLKTNTLLIEAHINAELPPRA